MVAERANRIVLLIDDEVIGLQLREGDCAEAWRENADSQFGAPRALGGWLFGIHNCTGN